VKLNTQYMHSIWFNLELTRDTTVEEVKQRLRDNPLVAATDKRYANLIFSFGRDHGYYGRILSQTVVVMPTIAVRRKREVYGFCFTPQDGNSLLSSVSAALWLIEPDWESVRTRLQPLRRWLFREI
jgi:glyceraldehyde-3-phosphate dehydrogenase (NAD(P))